MSGSSYDSSSEPANQPTKGKGRLKDIQHEFRPIEQVVYTLFQTKQPWPTKALLSSTFPTQLHLYDYFTLFFTPDPF